METTESSETIKLGEEEQGCATAISSKDEPVEEQQEEKTEAVGITGTTFPPQESTEERALAGQLEKEEQQQAEMGENSTEIATAENSDTRKDTVVTSPELPQM